MNVRKKYNVPLNKGVVEMLLSTKDRWSRFVTIYRREDSKWQEFKKKVKWWVEEWKQDRAYYDRTYGQYKDDEQVLYEWIRQQHPNKNRGYHNSIYDEMKKRFELMWYKEKHKIIQEVAENDVVLIKWATGCGKTTQLPIWLMEYFNNKPEYSEMRMWCTQPRRMWCYSV